MNGMIFHKCLNCLIGSKTKSFVKLSRSSVAVFGTLPEESVVVAQEWSVLHLRLVLEDGVSLEAQLLRRHRHSHLDIVHLPFHPCAAVHPYAAVLEPRLRVFQFVNGCQHGVQAYLVGAVRVCQVACHEDFLRLQLLQQCKLRFYLLQTVKFA